MGYVMCEQIGRVLICWVLLCGVGVNIALGESTAQQNLLRVEKCAGPSCGASSGNEAPTVGASDEPFALVGSEYIIGPEDVLEVTVWHNQDLSKVVAVRPDGRISLPLINDAVAAGKTPARLTKELSTLLREYVEKPSVSVIVKEINSYNIYLLGEVLKPGKYPVKIKTNLLQGIAIAGGFTVTAARDRLIVYRFAKKGEKLKINYDDIVVRDDAQQNIELMPGDMILVPSQKTVLR